MKEAKELLEIIKCFLKNQECAITDVANEENLYKLAQFNKMSNFLQNWAKINCKSEKIKKAIKQDYNTQILKDTNENVELEKILNKFEEAKIETLIVKGAVMKEIYPQNYMRQMCDIDIMVHGEDFKSASKIMKELGYDEFYNHEKHLIFTKGPLITIELHRKLILERDIGHDYFENIWPLCVKYKDYQNIYVLNIEDAYIFCMLHLIIHFKFEGICIRDILDVYLYNEKYKDILDYSKLNEKFNELGIKDFEQNIRNIAYKWFGENRIQDFDDVEEFILKGANINNRVNYHVGDSDGKGNYLVKLFFPEFKIMKEKYPILKKVPVLLPAMWVARIFKDVFSKETTVKTRLDTIKLIQEANQEEVEHIKEIYKKLGID